MLSVIYSYLDRTYNSRYFLIKYRIIKLLINIFLPAYYKVSKRNKLNSEANVIISLTTFPKRIQKVQLVIESLLRQSEMPKNIILYLSKEQFENFSILPDGLKKLSQQGYLTIKFVDNDYKSHKKYYYAVKEFEQYDIVTVDDDIFYPEDFLEALVNTHINHPNAVCCFWADKIIINDKKICDYDKWTTDVQCEKEIFNLLPIGCAGVYYPTGCFLVSQLLDVDAFMLTCPRADDIWLRCNTMLNNINVVKSGYYKHFVFIDIIIRNNIRLCDRNVKEKENDLQFKKVINLYPQIEEYIIEKSK